MGEAAGGCEPGFTEWTHDGSAAVDGRVEVLHSDRIS